MMACSAGGPPVEVPMTTISAMWADFPRRRAGRRSGHGRGCSATRSFGTPARARTFSRSSWDSPSRFMWPWTLVLSTKSIAPSSRPRSVTSAPSLVCELSSSTGVGHSVMIRRRASRPSTRGILTSRVTTSGRRALIFAIPSAPSVAEATTSISGSEASMRVRACRTNAESSTIRTRITAAPPRPSGFRYAIAPWKRMGTKRSVMRDSDSAWPRKRCPPGASASWKRAATRRIIASEK